MPTALSDMDIKILTALQENSRLTVQELAERVGTSSSSCWRRLRSLEETAVIRRYTVLVDPKAVAVGECVFAHVTLNDHSAETAAAFIKVVRERPEVLECYAVSGDADYLLRVAVREIADYHRFLEEFVFQLPFQVQIRSNFALNEIKFETALPLRPPSKR
ncbi:MAG TPA: Lrp/AsnC family transcriptional regulator [Azospirillum sp.]|nr:Lrp/AsnC family transcriptional regulator [Azospirillum sp.]